MTIASTRTAIVFISSLILFFAFAIFIINHASKDIYLSETFTGIASEVNVKTGYKGRILYQSHVDIGGKIIKPLPSDLRVFPEQVVCVGVQKSHNDSTFVEYFIFSVGECG